MAKVGEERFNPTLVRLRHLTQEGEDGARDEFQSHAGSIEAGDIASAVGISVTSFNPTLVRLRRRQPVQDGPAQDEFQSHAGSIEAPGGTRTPIEAA